MHRLFEKLPALGNDNGVDHQHCGSPCTGAQCAGPNARHETDGRHKQQDYERSRDPVLCVLAQQLVIEGGARAAR